MDGTWGSSEDKTGAEGLSDGQAGKAGYCVVDFDRIEAIPGQCVRINLGHRINCHRLSVGLRFCGAVILWGPASL